MLLLSLKKVKYWTGLSLGLALCPCSLADEVLFTVGAGPQHGTDQRNEQVSIDYSFYHQNRSPRSGLSIGVSYTRLTTDAASNRSMEAYTLYPQLTLWPTRESLQGWSFFVRALGPSYISSNNLGARKQDNHFAFQAQVGLGYEVDLGNNRALLLQASFKHFSNANLFHDNDGIDIPFVFSLGYKF